MSIKDVIKKGVLEAFGGNAELTIWQVVCIMFAACAIGVFVYFVYKFFTRKEFYSKDLNVTIAGMSIIVAAIMIAMQSNVLVSMGMVGALSIVRFRTAVKNPMDLLYLFWSISAGIICGVGLYTLAIGLCAIMTIMIFLLEKVPNNKAPSLLVLHTDCDIQIESIDNILNNNCKYYKQKSIIIRGNDTEIIYELNAISTEKLMSDLNAASGIKSINWIDHDGECRI